MSHSLQILVIEDSEDDAALLLRHLRRAGYTVTAKIVSTGPAMREAIKSQAWDVITSDHSMPQFSAPAALAIAKELCPQIPFIIVSGEIDLKLAVMLMRDGAKDFIQKQELDRLDAAIERELHEAQLHMERRQVEAALVAREEQLREILENSIDAFYKRNLKTNFYEYFSPGVLAITGFSANEIRNLPFETIMARRHPDDTAAVDDQLIRAIAGEAGASNQSEFRYLHKDGTYRWLQDRFSIMRADHGEPVAIIGSIRDITERKQADEAIQTANMLFNTLVSSVPMGIYVIHSKPDGTFRFDYASPKLAEIFHVRVEDFLSNPQQAYVHIHPEDLQGLIQLNSEVFQNPRPFAWEGRTVVNGQIKWLQIQSLPSFLENGDILWNGIVADRTESKQVENSLRASQDLLAEAQYIARLGSWEWDMLQHTVSWSEGMFRVYDIDPDTFDEKPESLLKIIHPDDREIFSNSLNANLADGSSPKLEYRIIHRDGSIHHIQAQGKVIFDQYGRPVRSIGTAQDITEAKQLSEALRASEEKHKRMIAGIADVISVMDREGINRYISPNIEKWFGWKAEERLGQPGWNVVHPDDLDRIRQEFARITASYQAEGKVEFRYLCRDGSYKWIELTGVNRLDDPVIDGILTNFHDITEQKLAQEQINQLNVALEARVAERTAQLIAANKEMEAFSYSVSHDLRAPLRTIDGFSLALMEDCADQLDENGRGHLTRIRDAARRMSRLIEDLLKLSRISRAEFAIQHINLSELARRITAESISQFPQRKFAIKIEDGLILQGDENLLKIALENLIENAVKFTSQREVAEIAIGSFHQDCSRVYYIKDNGAGFQMAYASKLFGPFQRLHGEKDFPGIGIGLATVQRIIARHGGRIWADAVEGEGATFYFTLGE